MVNTRDSMLDVRLLVIETGNGQAARPFEVNGEVTVRRPLPGEYIVLSLAISGMEIDSVTLPRIFQLLSTIEEVGSGPEPVKPRSSYYMARVLICLLLIWSCRKSAAWR